MRSTFSLSVPFFLSLIAHGTLAGIVVWSLRMTPMPTRSKSDLAPAGHASVDISASKTIHATGKMQAHEQSGDHSGAQANNHGMSPTNSAPMTSYLAGVRARIQNAVHYPLSLRRRGITGTVQLQIGLGSRGEIKTAEIHETSGHEELDRSALEAVHEVAPFSAPPEGEIGFTLPVEYRLAETPAK
jgi:TonB family protein